MKISIRKTVNLMALGLLLTVVELIAATTVTAQSSDQPTGTLCQPGVICAVGPYKIMVSFDRNSFDTTNDYVMAVQWQGNTDNNWQVTGAEIVPQPGTDAIKVKYDADRILSTTDPHQKQIKGYFPISGDWWIHVTINSTQGAAQFLTEAIVAAPPKMPIWLAWAIGLSPIIGIVGFFVGQWRLVRRRKRAERQVSYSN